VHLKFKRWDNRPPFWRTPPPLWSFGRVISFENWIPLDLRAARIVPSNVATDQEDHNVAIELQKPYLDSVVMKAIW
jgi:hypothetical protein